MFLSTGSGFKMTFDNGVTVSVQFGYGTYSDNYDNYNIDIRRAASMSAEVAIFKDGRRNWLTESAWFGVFGFKLDDDVAGYVSADDVAAVIAWAKDYKGE